MDGGRCHDLQPGPQPQHRGRAARYRLTVGATLPVHRHFSVEPYLVRQVDYAGSSVIVSAIGLLLIAAF